MNQLAPGLWHWTAWHPRIEATVHSYYYEPAGLLIDPMLPKEGLAWFRKRAKPPKYAALTNRHHYRHSGEYRQAFGVEVFCHPAGLHEFEPEDGVVPFPKDGLLPGRVRALTIGSLCPEESALVLPGGSVALGDAVVRDKTLTFVPDAYMGADPETVKRGMRAALARLCRRKWQNLLMAHGTPLVKDGRERLRRYLER